MPTKPQKFDFIKAPITNRTFDSLTANIISDLISNPDLFVIAGKKIEKTNDKIPILDFAEDYSRYRTEIGHEAVLHGITREIVEGNVKKLQKALGEQLGLETAKTMCKMVDEEIAKITGRSAAG